MSKLENMYSFTSLDTFVIKGKRCFAVLKVDDPLGLLGKDAMIDGIQYRVIGVEHPLSKKDRAMGLMTDVDAAPAQ